MINKQLYYEIKDDCPHHLIVLERTWINYVHSFLVCSFFFTCIKNDFIFALMISIILCSSVILKLFCLIRLCKKKGFLNAKLKSEGKRFSLKNPLILHFIESR